MQTSLAKKHEHGKMALTVAFAVICIIYVLPILIVLMNSFKSNAAVNTETFAFPNEDSFVGVQNYIKGMTFGNYPFWKSAFYSLFITVVSSALILLCTSMAAWYIARVDSKLCRIIYYLCVFSMVVPFQMVMFTLSKTADRVKIPFFNFADMAFDKVALNTPWTIPIIYLGFGAGLAIFMFLGFVKGLPKEIEEAAFVDGAGTWYTYFRIMLVNAMPAVITVTVFSLVWQYTDSFYSQLFRIPTDMLLAKRLSTLQNNIQANLKIMNVRIQRLYVDAGVVLTILPLLILYLLLQRRFIEGVERSGIVG